jgi:hypothetical protein
MIHFVSKSLTIGGLVIQVNSASGLRFVRAKRFLQFYRSSVHHDIRWNFHVVDRDSGKSAERIIQAAQISNNDKRTETACLVLRSKQVRDRLAGIRSRSEWVTRETHPDALVVLDIKGNRADMFFDRSTAKNTAGRMISAALLAPFLPHFEGILLHAAAVVRSGRAAVFLAPDGGGKTSAARLSPAGTILCDDQVLVRRHKKGFRVHGTPWGLYVDARRQAPLAGLFLLNKAERFALLPCPAHEMIAHIWEEARNSLSMLPKPLKKKAFGIICDIVASVPSWKISFPRDHIDWQAIDRAMTAPAGGRTARAKKPNSKSQAAYSKQIPNSKGQNKEADGQKGKQADG